MNRFRALAMTLALVLALLAVPQPALAGKPILVGNGTAASCTETALRNALLLAETIGGATIQFKCGPVPVTIALSQTTDIDGMVVFLVLPNNTTIDGGGLITLDGAHTATVIFVDHDTTVGLKGLSIINGLGTSFAFERGAGGIVNVGILTVSNSIVQAHLSGDAGGVLNEGTLTVLDSTIAGNGGFFAGGGIQNKGSMTLQNTNVSDNSTGFFGGGVANFGTLTAAGSTFARNYADSEGGGIGNYGTAKVSHSTFSENDTARGGGILNSGTLKVSHSTFSGNSSASVGGGGILNSGALTVDSSTFLGNFTFRSGAGISNFGTLKVDNSTFSQNFSFLNGGGIFTAGTAIVDNSIITHNTASLGGGIYVCVEGQEADFAPCHGTLILKDSTVTENTPDDIFPF